MRISDWSSDVCSSDLDARLPAGLLQVLLREAVDKSFNCITVDGDTSTSDTLLLGATGKAKHPRISDLRDPRLAGFRTALEDLLRDLAQQVVRDGEGASKFITIRVSGAASRRSEEHTSELQSLMRISYAVFCLKKKNTT